MNLEPQSQTGSPSNSGSRTVNIAGHTLTPGQTRRIEVPVSRLPTGSWLSIPLEVVAGVKPGPTVWLSAAIHGDEVAGIEIIRRVLAEIRPDQLSGTLIAAPIVNVFGFIEQSRYLPDRRDLNRSFPGSKRGSLASRLAHLFMSEVVHRADYGIDLHTGSNHRTNLPQIRANLEHQPTLGIAQAFAAPVMVHADTRDGSLRQAAASRGVPVVVYEAGEPLRFDEQAIELGHQGVLRVLAHLKMRGKPAGRAAKPLRVEKTSWVRARRAGILRLGVGLGDRVREKQRLGTIADAFGEGPLHVVAPCSGLVIGHTNNPLVQQGDAVVHLAEA